MDLFREALMKKRASRSVAIAAVILGFLLMNRISIATAASGEVIITHASMSTSSIPLWVAQRRDFFRKHGVNAKNVSVRGNPAQIATLVSGDTQIAYAARQLPSPPLSAGET